MAGVISAEFVEPTTRYAHGILGDEIEYGALVLRYHDAGLRRGRVTIRLPLDHVFEDIEPRLIDIDGDGDFEVMVVETDVAKGAQLAIYDETGKIAATPHIGRTHRWLAPIGAADLDGDGAVEIAYIDRPHLARVLKIWRYENGKLTLVAERGGLTNHQIGQNYISGGIRDCGAGLQLITANADWSKIIASVFENGQIRSAEIGRYKGRRSFKQAMECRK
ncbi:integrin [Marinosulfonomonas sp. PRT-SC04]|nr:integrin [Marinosulfonomonas sp. PRT-SC04]